MKRVAVVGLGNILVGDDAFGPYAIHELEARYDVGGVGVLDLGTPGLDLAPHLEGLDALIVLDTVSADASPGTIREYRKPELLARPAPAHREPAPPASPPAPRTRTLRMTVTAYCPCPKCCGKWSDGQTASGKSIYANGSRFVAADTRLLPFGTRIVVPGYAGGEAVPVLDRGGRIKGRRLDLFFLSHRQAKEWGTRELEITVYLD
ncbi:MAG: hydrogenase maturation protease [Gemmatimonadota bacterium]